MRWFYLLLGIYWTVYAILVGIGYTDDVSKFTIIVSMASLGAFMFIFFIDKYGSSKSQKEVDDPDEVKNINIVCYWLIEKCVEANAESMKITQSNVTRSGKKLGDWEVEVKNTNKNEK